MSLKAIFLAICLTIASFGAMSVVAPGEALAHPGHHGPAAASEPSHSDMIAPDASIAMVDPADDVADGGCLTSCCVGASCCPSTLAVQVDQTPPFPTAVRLIGRKDAPQPDLAAEPLPEPPRSIV